MEVTVGGVLDGLEEVILHEFGFIEGAPVGVAVVGVLPVEGGEAVLLEGFGEGGGSFCGEGFPLDEVVLGGVGEGLFVESAGFLVLLVEPGQFGLGEGEFMLVVGGAVLGPGFELLEQALDFGGRVRGGLVLESDNEEEEPGGDVFGPGEEALGSDRIDEGFGFVGEREGLFEVA